MALFVTFEGGEGCGKSVQARALYRRLSQLAIPVLLIHEPGGTPLGNKIGYWLKWGRNTRIAPLTELLLFNASRAQLVAEVIQPSLKAGKVVISDRFFDSTIAYQSYGRGLELAMVESICHAATRGLKPDLTVLLDIPAEEGLARKSARKHDRFEQAGLAFHRRVRSGYLKMAKEEPERWLVIDARQAKKKIAEIIWQKVSQLLQTK
jgi:dTMP kinase